MVVTEAGGPETKLSSVRQGRRHLRFTVVGGRSPGDLAGVDVENRLAAPNLEQRTKVLVGADSQVRAAGSPMARSSYPARRPRGCPSGKAGSARLGAVVRRPEDLAVVRTFSG